VIDPDPARNGTVVTYSIVAAARLVVSVDPADEAHNAVDRPAAEYTEAREARCLAFDGVGPAIADCVPGERIVTVV